MNDRVLKHISRKRECSRFFIVELQIFCWGQIRLKLVGTSALPHISRFLYRDQPRLGFGPSYRNQDGAYSAKIETCFVGNDVMLKETLVHVTLLTIPHWLRYARAPIVLVHRILTDKEDVLRSSTVKYSPTSPDLVVDLSDFTAH